MKLFIKMNRAEKAKVKCDILTQLHQNLNRTSVTMENTGGN